MNKLSWNNQQEKLYECSLTILESHSTILKGKTDIASDNSLKTFCSCNLSKTTFSSISSMQYNHATCTCYLLPKEQANETLNRNDYLRYFFYNYC